MQTGLAQDIRDFEAPKVQGQIDEEEQERSDDEFEDEQKARTGFRSGHVSETNSFKLKSD